MSDSQPFSHAVAGQPLDELTGWLIVETESRLGHPSIFAWKGPSRMFVGWESPFERRWLTSRRAQAVKHSPAYGAAWWPTRKAAEAAARQYGLLRRPHVTAMRARDVVALWRERRPHLPLAKAPAR